MAERSAAERTSARPEARPGEPAPAAARQASAPVDRPAPRATRGAPDGPRIAVVADDLIWATRLEALARGAGARPARVRDIAGLERLLADGDEPSAAIVDLTSRAYDGVAAIALAAAHVPVLAVAQHDDTVLRRRALDAGAGRVLPYAKMHADGPRVVAAWLESIALFPGARA